MTDSSDEAGRTKSPPGQRNMVALAIYAIIVVVVVSMAVFYSFQRGGLSADIRNKATLIAPAGAGGGWDLVMREAQAIMREQKIATNIQVVNVPGAAGTIGLSRLHSMPGRADVVMVGGTGLVAGVQQTKSAVTMTDVTPIARIFEEYDVLVVPANSPYKSVDDLVAAWKSNPHSIPFTGGGSFDQLVMAQFAKAAGIDPKNTTYIPKAGGGEVAQALVTGTAKAAFSGYADLIDQIQSGRLRGLAMAAKEPLDGVDFPTLRQLGYDVTLANWRALFGPPDISPADVKNIRDVFDEVMRTQDWADAERNNKWTRAWLEGPDLTTFIADEDRVIAGLYKELGK
ncbi:Bug family tripartite tricarboxylate transporter substrate binding protein [Tsukamurella tyrosinosolvens]|uniref:Bug family tripartite tricarboxylate transporter substrate binding protein n=1 Tax=Tsukamurella tyrosinosolvens TaxID=57704 RepID=UPI002162A462|nr:tripartite tricarboxylate transporter substrate-binding protein [Tsukamurella tyrosinosolvens]MEC4612775.1 tripartite tricarboxylate transporter substrate-binding protein [Tsukamurella tyrosinosolvens]